jgi:hypothetical protein
MESEFVACAETTMETQGMTLRYRFSEIKMIFTQEAVVVFFGDVSSRENY